MEFVVLFFVGIIVILFNFWIEGSKLSKNREQYKNASDKYLKNKNFSFTKRIDISLDSENKLEFLVNDDERKFAILSCNPKISFLSGEQRISEEHFNINIFDFSDMIKFELLLDCDEVLQGRGLASTGGALLFGVTGAVIGASGQRKVLKQNKSIVINIFLNKVDCPLISINFPTVIKTDTLSIENYEQQLQQAKTLQGVLYYIEQQNKNIKQSVKSENDITTKIKQLNELKEQGLISEEEFNNKKKDLLNNL